MNGYIEKIGLFLGPVTCFLLPFLDIQRACSASDAGHLGGLVRALRPRMVATLTGATCGNISRGR